MSRSRRKSSKRSAVSQTGKPESATRHLSHDWGGLSQDVLFFICFFLFLWLYVDLRLIYHGAGVITNFPVFYKGWSFFLPFLSYPGGLVEYLAAFLSQLFYFSWAGAVVITIQAWLISLCIGYLLKVTNSTGLRGIRFLPPILLLVLYTRYTYHFVTTMVLLAALFTACIYLKATLTRSSISSGAGVVFILSVVFYYLSGGAFLFFAVVCAAYELIFRFRWKLSLFYMLFAAAIPYVVGLLIFRINILDAYSNLLPFSWQILNYEVRTRGIEIVYGLYLFPLLILFLTGLWHTLWERQPSARSRTDRKSAGKHRKGASNLPARISSWYGRSPKLKYVTGLLLVFVVAGVAVFYGRDENLRTRFKVDYYACHRMWPELLTSAQRHPTDPFVAHAVNRALCHRGRLGYDMFSWPQHPDYLFLSDEKYKWQFWQIFDLFLDLGVVNIAENALTECLEGLGSRPMILQ